ncbi:TonB-dependent receptor domain-containing protein [Immundisolibacter sp.]|uniref:TonB-dependent receptor domain-containing protein n=1 Tax=Immundisolibacter sp. TaxID=1934948 RepID=UPI0035649399
MDREWLSGLVRLCLALIILVPMPAQACDHWLVRLASIRGVVEVQLPGAAGWRVARSGEAFCGDVSVRVGEGGSAVLELANDTVLRLSGLSAASIRQDPSAPTLTAHIERGRGHFLSRTRQRFDVSTPYLNAAIDGTEFLLSAAPQGDELIVFDGRVMVDGQSVAPGQRLRVGSAGTRELEVAVRSREGLDWALYYPPLATGALGEARQRLAAGDIPAAAQLAAAAVRSDDPAQRAEAVALQAVIAIAQGDMTLADALSRDAVALAPALPNAWLARSYARQAVFDLPGALAAAARAVDLAPADGLPTLRLAELELASGNHRAARRLAQAAVDGSAAALALRTLGFAHLLADDAQAAQAAFEHAALADPLDPLARLGLGLALIRHNRLATGRRQMEIGVSLDPGQSLLRSYLAKAYLSERRRQPAQAELGRAKALDPADPTPWFYEALALLADNRPVEALAAIEESIKRNDNRAVYRSKLQLDEDLAARQAGAGRAYEALGFTQLAQRRGAESLAADPADFSAHRLLADSYLGMPQHETGRLSELLQAQLWQPQTVLPLQPRARAEDLAIRQGAVSLQSGLNEYTPLFVRDGVTALASAVGGGDGLFSDDLMATVLAGPLSVSAAQFHYETDGFRHNADQAIDLYNLFAHWRVTPDTSVQAEVRRSERERGDIALYPFPDVASPTLRRFDDVDTYRLGLRHTWLPGNDTLLSVQRQNARRGQDYELELPPEFELPPLVLQSREQARPWLAEAQQVLTTRLGTLQVGGGFYRENLSFGFGNGFFSFADESRTEQRNGYMYGHLDGPARTRWTVGVAIDEVETTEIKETHWSPKLGLTWMLDDSTTLRAVALRAVKRELVGKGTIEPVQVAGFVQYFDDNFGTRSERYGLGLDRRLRTGLDVGVEATWRKLKKPYFELVPPDLESAVAAFADAREQLHRAYVYWTPAPRWALRAEYRYQGAVHAEEAPAIVESGAWEIFRLRTQSLPLGIRYSHPAGWLADLSSTAYWQSGDFLLSTSGQPRHARDDFWVSNARLAWGLPRRTGLLSVGVLNLFDQAVRFQDADPEHPLIHPRRLLYGSLSLYFD